jgi:membrane-associated protease RseP (regulator of RpoE activity)
MEMRDQRSLDDEEPADEASSDDDPSEHRPNFRLAGPLFIATALSMFLAGGLYDGKPDESFLTLLPRGWRFAVPLLLILLFHEFGHYLAARYHKVAVSLPYFIPVPFLTPFGTMGAVIAMPDRIRSRNALFDIGAAGPLAGLLVTVPVLVIGLSSSPVSVSELPYTLEGQSLFYWLMKRLVLGPIPDGSDITMNQTAFAGWAGLFVTAINLIPVGQLDGGHIAYSLFGPRQDRYANLIHYGLLLVFGYNLAKFVVPALLLGTSLGTAVSNSTFYLVWFFILLFLKRRTRVNHPPTDDHHLSPVRRALAWLCLALFLLLFMPTPFAVYE